MSNAYALHPVGGLIPTETIYPSVPITNQASFPVSVDLTAYSMPIGDQGSVGSCVAWAVGYGLMGWYANKNSERINAFAPMHMYSQINVGRSSSPKTDSGAYPADAFKLLINQGIDSQLVYSIKSNYDWQSTPSTSDIESAVFHKISGFNTLFSLPNGRAGAVGADQIRAALSSGSPVAIGLPVRSGFDALSPSSPIDSDTSSAIRGYHEVLAIGYNSQGVVIQNSWGTGWGINGFGTLAWNVVQNDLTSAHTANYITVPNPSIAAVQQDKKAIIQTTIFEYESSLSLAHTTRMVVPVPNDYVVIGGGVQGSNNGAGNLLVDSYPSDDLTAWIVSAKDHKASSPARVKAWAIGLKVQGLTSSQLKPLIKVTKTTSSLVSQTGSIAAIPSGNILLGGGFQVRYLGSGNLAVASAPSADGLSWMAASQEQIDSSPATITSYAISMPSKVKIPNKFLPLIFSVFRNHVLSISEKYPHIENISTASGYALTGCGAIAYTDKGPGELLWKIQPQLNSCSVAARDVYTPSTGFVGGYSLGLKVK